jgi:hypothetical protein
MGLIIQIEAVADQFVEVDFGRPIGPPVTASVAAGPPGRGGRFPRFICCVSSAICPQDGHSLK